MSKTSIIIPCYNVENFIDDCMNSILSQTIGLKNLEIILVDDKSTDNTVERLKYYEENYSEYILLVLSEKNGRQGTARNIGLSYATGDFVCFVDADDWIRTDMLEYLTSIMEETDADLVQFRYIGKMYPDEEEPLSSVDYCTYDYSDKENRRKYILQSDIMNESCTTKLYRRELLLQSGVSFAEGVAYEEPLFTYPLKFFVNKIAVVDVPFYYYRYNENGTTASYMNQTSTIVEHLYVQKMTYEFVRQQDFYSEFGREIDLYFIHSFFVEPFYFLKYRGEVLPLILFRYMSEELKKMIPDYEDNYYLMDASLIEERRIVGLIQELADTDDLTAQQLICEMQEGLR